jgi:myo-inositol 2-dehydrogenase/D-chiro-inositol 1-dehydrogenase
MTALRIGLLGAGWISRTYAAALRRVPDAELAAVWSRSRDRAERFAAEFGCAVACDRVERVFPHVDVVCVNSPNFLHAEHAIAAAEAGKHVIVEKPLAVSLEQGLAIVAACERAGVGLAYAEELPFVPKFARLRELLASGALGGPLYATQREAHAGPYSPWFFTREEAGGGVLMDLACHSIECLRWLLDRPAVVAVTAELASLRHGDRGPLEDHAVVHLEFAAGIRGLVEASWALEGGMQSRLEVFGARGYAEADLCQGSGLRVFSTEGALPFAASPGWATPPVDWLWENGYPQELAHFLDCFRSGTAPSESGADGVAVLEILSAAYASARRGRRIALPFRPTGVARAVDLWLEDPEAG